MNEMVCPRCTEHLRNLLVDLRKLNKDALKNRHRNQMGFNKSIEVPVKAVSGIAEILILAEMTFSDD